MGHCAVGLAGSHLRRAALGILGRSKVKTEWMAGESWTS